MWLRTSKAKFNRIIKFFRFLFNIITFEPSMFKNIYVSRRRYNWLRTKDRSLIILFLKCNFTSLNRFSADKKKHVSHFFLSSLTYFSFIKIGGGHLARFPCKSENEYLIFCFVYRFLCVCCQELVFKPVTTPCAHNICQSCLKRGFRAGVYSCPTCRRELEKNQLNLVNEPLASALLLLYPGYENTRWINAPMSIPFYSSEISYFFSIKQSFVRKIACDFFAKSRCILFQFSPI